jgi:hypothetical protein
MASRNLDGLVGAMVSVRPLRYEPDQATEGAEFERLPLRPSAAANVAKPRCRARGFTR